MAEAGAGATKIVGARWSMPIRLAYRFMAYQTTSLVPLASCWSPILQNSSEYCCLQSLGQTPLLTHVADLQERADAGVVNKTKEITARLGAALPVASTNRRSSSAVLAVRYEVKADYCPMTSASEPAKPSCGRLRSPVPPGPNATIDQSIYESS